MTKATRTALMEGTSATPSLLLNGFGGDRHAYATVRSRHPTARAAPRGISIMGGWRLRPAT
jgi:hypothetical protein